MMYRSPFFSARVLIIEGSEPPPGAGSVIVNVERTFPSTIGLSHFSFCSRVPTNLSTFMLPSSGAMQLNDERPENRARGLLVNGRPGNDRQIHAAEFFR